MKQALLPLNYSDPAGEFYGYDEFVRMPEGLERPGTKRLVHLIGWAATSLIAIQARKYVARKCDWLRLYQACIGDSWTPFLEAIYGKCKQQWSYLIPDDASDRRLLRDLCQQALAFENHYFTTYRAYLLAELHNGARDHRLFAAHQLKDTFYPDSEIVAALEGTAL